MKMKMTHEIHLVECMNIDQFQCISFLRLISCNPLYHPTISGAFICQSQSLNIHMAEPTTARLTSMHFYAWKRGLKTGMYYLRTRPKGACASTKLTALLQGDTTPLFYSIRSEATILLRSMHFDPSKHVCLCSEHVCVSYLITATCR